MDNKKCTDCIGLHECNKYCYKHAGAALIKYLDGIRLLPTRIGDISKGSKMDPVSRVVKGHVETHAEAPGAILGTLDLKIDISDKFNEVFGMTATQLVKRICSDRDMDSTEYCDKLNGINRFKLLVDPFKTGVTFNVKANGKRSSTNLRTIKWCLDKEMDTDTISEESLKCELIFIKSLKGETSVKKNISEYLTSFFIKDANINEGNSNFNKNLISINSLGFIKPIEFIEKNCSYIIDGCYIYKKTDKETNVIGYWNGNNLDIIEKGQISKKANSVISDNLALIRTHKTYIVPYRFIDTVKVNI